MNIFPMNRKEADKRHWVVRCLRGYAYLITGLFTVAGFAFGSTWLAQLLLAAVDWPKLLCVALTTFAGGVLGLCLGLLVSLPLWAISMAIDDLHATRLYMQGFVTIGDKDDAPRT